MNKSFIVTLIVGFLLLWGCEEFIRREIGGFAGSYPDVETWQLDASESEVVKAIEELRKSDPYFQAPKNEPINCEEKSSYWCHLNFYYPERREIVLAWIRSDYDSTSTTFALVGFDYEGNPSAPRMINKNFWYIANKLEIRKFEDRIVNPIKDKIKNNKQQITTE